MAQNNSGAMFRNVALVVATIGGGAALGYYVIGGAHPAPAPEAAGVQEAPLPPTPPSAPAHVAPRPKPTQVSSDYTAPNAPRIHIVEDKTPTLNDSAARPKDTQTSATDILTPDVEASQQGGASSGSPKPAASSDVGTADGTPGPGPDTPPAPNTNSDTEAGQTGTNNATPPAKPKSSPGAASGDTEADQTGAGDTTDTAKNGSHAAYRVQAGSFADAGNARDYVNSLHDRGLDADLHTEHQGEKTVYKVQVGAYRSRAAADDAAADLRQKGVPASVSPVTP